MTLDEALAEIERLRAELQEAKQLVLRLSKERFMRDVAEAWERGALSKPSQSEPAGFTWNEPPTTPGNELP